MGRRGRLSSHLVVRLVIWSFGSSKVIWSSGVVGVVKTSTKRGSGDRDSPVEGFLLGQKLSTGSPDHPMPEINYPT